MPLNSMDRKFSNLKLHCMHNYSRLHLSNIQVWPKIWNLCEILGLQRFSEFSLYPFLMTMTVGKYGIEFNGFGVWWTVNKLIDNIKNEEFIFLNLYLFLLFLHHKSGGCGRFNLGPKPWNSQRQSISWKTSSNIKEKTDFFSEISYTVTPWCYC